MNFLHFGPNPCEDSREKFMFVFEDLEVTCPECRKLNGFAQTTLTDGTQVYPSHRELKENGQQKDYVVLSEAEREKGLVRPVRDSYIHLTCGYMTTMSRSLAETYARDPEFYSGTFCSQCRKHFPVGKNGEFVWAGTEEKVET